MLRRDGPCQRERTDAELIETIREIHRNHDRLTLRKVVGDPCTSLVIEVLATALLARKPPKGVIFHSYRGCQYTSKELDDFCVINGVRRSMIRRATCYDNAVSAPFFVPYKKLIHT